MITMQTGPIYPLTILNDAAGKPYVDGSAFHHVWRQLSALTQVIMLHPDKHVYFTLNNAVGGPGNFCR